MGRHRNGYLHQRGKRGTYYLQYTLNGQRFNVCLKTSDRKEALAEQRKIMAPYLVAEEAELLQQQSLRLRNKLGERELLDETLHPPTRIADMWEEFLCSHNRPRSGPRTLAGYRSHQNQLIEWLKDHHPEVVEMRDLDTRLAEEYADHLESLELSPSTFNQRLNALTMIWSVLARKARIETNPWAWDKATRTGIMRKALAPERSERRKRPLGTQELAAVFAKAKGDYHTLFMILLYTGQRLVDGVKLKWESIDFQREVISIVPQKTSRRSGKQVHIPLLPPLRQELESKFRDGKYVLPELVKSYDHDKGSVISKEIMAIFAEAEIETHVEGGSGRITKVGAHSFRHSFVTLARSAGLPDTVIQHITGHGSEQMVDHYTHFTPELVCRLAATLPKMEGKRQERLPPPSADTVEEVAALAEGMTAENWREHRKRILELLRLTGTSADSRNLP